MRKTKQKSNKGFSLVELTLVIALITIMATIGISTWNRYIINSNLREAARAIEADLKFMQRNARASAFTDLVIDNVLYTIEFDKTSNKYTLLAKNADDINAPPLLQREKKLFDLFDGKRSMTRIDSLPLGGSTFELTFDTRGTFTPAGTITLKNKRGSEGRIVYTVTGKIHVSFINR